MQKKILSSILAGTVAASLLVSNVFAADIVIKPGEETGLTKVTDPETAVEFKATAASKDWIVGGESDGLWLIGGDNGDIGISIDTLKNCDKIEIDYVCDNPIEGTKIGFAFKVHVDMESRVCEDGGYIFADYLPATWVPYGSGSDGKQPIAAVNSLETIYQAPVEESGTLSISAAELLSIFPEDMDYIMGLGIGADNSNDEIAQEDIDNEEEYTVDVTEIRFVMNEVQEPSNADDSTDDGKNQPNTGIEGVAVVAGLAILATGAVLISKKRK